MTKSEFEKVFNLPFAEAEAFFLAKLNLPSKKWDDYLGEIHAKAFMSAGAYHADLLTDLRGIVDRAIKGGMPLPEFRSQFRDLVKKHGWALKGPHGDPNSKEGIAWRADLIWRTNIATAYQAGRWKQFTDGTTKYLRYKHADGVMNPRPQHVAWNNLVLPIGHEFWQTHYPPNGFGCHCRAYHVDTTELDKWTKQGKTEPPEGWKDIDPKTGAPKGIDKGWGYNVGIAGLKEAADILANKLSKWDAVLGATMYEKTKPAARKAIKANYDEWLESALNNSPRKDYALLGSMGMKEIDFLKSKGKEPATSAIVINDRLVSGKKAKRHEKDGNALTPEEWRLLPNVVNEPEMTLYDKTNGSVLYVYPATEDPRKIKIVVQADEYIDKLKKTVNEVTTVFKIDGNALEDRTRYEVI